MSWWMIRDRATGEEQLVECEGLHPHYDGDLFEVAELDGEPDLSRERYDWEAGEIASSVTPEAAAADMLAQAQAYRETRRNAPLAVWGVFADRAIVVKMDVESRLTISGAVQMATLMKASGLPMPFTFDDEAGQETTIDADQTISLGLGVAVFSGRCDNALRGVRQTIKAALDGGATSAEIEALDITAGYPSIDGAGDPSSDPES